MGQWKDLPYEVVLLIAQELDSSDPKEKWMFVNRQLHEAYQF